MCRNGGYDVTGAGGFFILFKKRITDEIFTRRKKEEIANNLYAKMYMFDVALALLVNEI